MMILILVSLPDSEESKELLRLLDGLPLAIAQAGAFIRETNSSISEYVQFYKESWKDLMEPDNGSETPLEDYPNRSIYTTWTLSYNQIKLKDEGATNLLDLWACLDNKDLWFELFVPASGLT